MPAATGTALSQAGCFLPPTSGTALPEPARLLPSALETPVSEPILTLTLASCPVSQALVMATAGRPGGFLLPAREPEPLVSLTLARRPVRDVMREIAELAGFGCVAEGDFFILARPQTAAFYRRFADLDLPPGSPAISLAADRADLGDLLATIARRLPIDIVCHPDLAATLTVQVRDVPWRVLFHGLAAAAEADCRFATPTVFLAPRGRLGSSWRGN
ncbi:MAG: hypothetical protein GX442_00170 [Candidatus Riflebacteria bacterium]|nr:hypothetical protein [Candidatus Riflebacteria bacterium]